LEALEFLDGAAVHALGLRLVAQEQGPAVRLAGEAVEAFAESVVAVLGAGDLDISVAGHVRAHGDEWLFAGEGLIESGSEEAGFEARGAEEGLLSQRDALDGEQLLGVDGLVGRKEVGLEVSDFVERFEADDGKGRCGEAVLARVLRGAGLALRSARSGGVLRVGVVGRALFVGDGFVKRRQRNALSSSAIARGRAGV